MIVAVHLPLVQLELNAYVSVYCPSGSPAAMLVPDFGPTMKVIAYSPFQDGESAEAVGGSGEVSASDAAQKQTRLLRRSGAIGFSSGPLSPRSTTPLGKRLGEAADIAQARREDLGHGAAEQHVTAVTRASDHAAYRCNSCAHQAAVVVQSLVA